MRGCVSPRAANKPGGVMMRNRTISALIGVIGLLAASGPAIAQSYPTRPITLMVPFAPGGSTSTTARSIADKMSETLGQQIVIDNHSNASNTVTTYSVAKAAPNG